MFKRLFSSAIIFGAAALAPPAFAMTCADRGVVIDRLQSKFSESLAAGGLQQTRPTATVIEIWASEKSGTFTILVTDPRGISCVVASGAHFFQAKRGPKPEVSDSPAGIRRPFPD